MKEISFSRKNALLIGLLCSAAYLCVSLARNILTACSPHLNTANIFTEADLGYFSSVFFFSYAVGQLVNGYLGNKIKPKYMITFGLTAGAVCIFAFKAFWSLSVIPFVAYALLGFCLSMVFGPMTRLIAESVHPSLTARTTAIYTFAALFGSPLAGLFAVWFSYSVAFLLTGGVVLVISALCFILFLSFEKRKIIQNPDPIKKEKRKNCLSVLFKRSILRFTVISFVTGIIRTSVIFWLPTYLSQSFGFSDNVCTLLYTVGTLFVSASPFVSVFIYEKIRFRLMPTVLISFIGSAVCFMGTFLIKIPLLNIAFLFLAILFSGCADSIMWSVYCPSLNDTGMVSGATGYLDFISYIAAAISSPLFASLVLKIGWTGLILVWMSLMLIGILTSIKTKNQPL